MSEYISRETTIKKIAEVQDKATSGTEDVTYYRAIKIIHEIPSADVQPVKRGRWENTNTPAQLRYSNCDVIHYIAQYPHGEINYCPNCGARMGENNVSQDRCSNYMDCDGNCFIDDTPCDCGGDTNKCKGR